MDDREAELRYDRLVADLATLDVWLEHEGEPSWATWMREARRQILAHDGNGLSHLLRAYGGMGSFTDLPMDSATARVRTRAYEDATALLADLQR